MATRGFAIVAMLVAFSAPARPALADHAELRAALVEWLDRAWQAGMDDESIAALMATTLRAQVTDRTKRGEGAA